MLKKYFMNPLDRMSLFKSFLLFCIAMILFFTTAPIGFLYAVIWQSLAKRVHSLSVYFLELALALDNAGNVLMQHALDDALLIRNQNTYLFGNKMETISSVIGKNLVTHTLSPAGLLLNSFLHWIDKDHSLNSINYEVKLWESKNESNNI
jgi:8-oxo-dGTP diphosphatase